MRFTAATALPALAATAAAERFTFFSYCTLPTDYPNCDHSNSRFYFAGDVDGSPVSGNDGCRSHPAPNMKEFCVDVSNNSATFTLDRGAKRCLKWDGGSVAQFNCGPAGDPHDCFEANWPEVPCN